MLSCKLQAVAEGFESGSRIDLINVLLVLEEVFVFVVWMVVPRRASR